MRRTQITKKKGPICIMYASIIALKGKICLIFGPDYEIIALIHSYM